MSDSSHLPPRFSNLPHNLAVDGAADAVLQLEVHLGDGVLGEHGCIGNVTDGGALDHVADGETLDRLVLGCAARAVGAADRLHVAAALLIASTVLHHLCQYIDFWPRASCGWKVGVRWV